MRPGEVAGDQLQRATVFGGAGLDVVPGQHFGLRAVGPPPDGEGEFGEEAAARPDLVQNLVLVEPTVHLKKHPTLGVIGAVARTEVMCRWRGGAAGAATFLDWACRRTSGGSAFPAFPAALRAVVQRSAPTIIGEIRAGTGERLTAARIAAIDRPGTLVVGDWSDPAFGQAARRVAQLVPRWRTVRVPRAGHAVHFDQPEAFVQAVLHAG